MTTPHDFKRRRTLFDRSRLACGALVLALTTPARAQSSRGIVGDSLPRALVEALLRPYIGSIGNGGTEFTVGKVPPSLAPFLYLPPGAQVLGGITTPSTTVAIFTVPMPFEEVRSTYAREQPKLGWTVPEANRGFGFQPAPGANQSGGFEYCHVGQSLQINPTYSSNGVTQVTATVQSQNFGSRCSSYQAMVMGGIRPQGPEMPSLFNPSGAAMNQQACLAGVTGFGGTSSQSERLQSMLTAPQLVDYFGKQLSDSGWAVSPNPATAARRVWTHPDTGGTTREISVTVLPSQYAGAASNCQDVTMYVRQVPGVKR